MTAIILSLLALATSIPVALKRREHGWIVGVLAATLLYSAVGDHMSERGDMVLRALIPLATSLAYVVVWEAPHRAHVVRALGYAWSWLIACVLWSPSIADWWGVVSIGPCVVSVIVGAVCLARWCGPSLLSARRYRLYVRHEHARLPIYAPVEWTITTRVAAFWLLGDAAALLLAWKASTMLKYEGMTELALLALYQAWWLIRETRSTSAPRDP